MKYRNIAIAIILAIALGSLFALSAKPPTLSDVTIINTESNPLIIKEAPLEPFQKTLYFSLAVGETTKIETFDVPANKLLVIEFAQPTGVPQNSYILIQTDVGGNLVNYTSIGMSPVRAYADPGTQVKVFYYNWDPPAWEARFPVLFSGYFVDSP